MEEPTAMEERARLKMYFNEGIIAEASATYHSKRGVNVSSHGLTGDFKKSPANYHAKVTGEIKDVDRPAYKPGRAAHSLILEGRKQFEKDFCWNSPINEKTNKPYGPTSKPYLEWAEGERREIITPDQLALVEAMEKKVRKHEQASYLLSNGIAEGVIRVDLPVVKSNYRVQSRVQETRTIPCQIRMDYFNFEEGLVDLKTCDDIDYFEPDSRRYRYVHQLAFYRSVIVHKFDPLGELWEQGLLPVRLIAVEKKPPHRVGVWRIGDYVLGIAQGGNDLLLAEMEECRLKNVWPTRYEKERTLEMI